MSKICSTHCLLATLILMSETASFADANVTKVIKKRGVVIIDSGRIDDVKRGDRYCIHRSSGKKVTCGRIKKVKRRKSALKVPRSKLRKIKTGMLAKAKTKTYQGGGSYLMIAPLIVSSSPVKYNLIYYVPQGDQPDILWEADGAITSGAGIAVELGLGLVALGGRFQRSDELVSIEEYRQIPNGQFVEINHRGQAVGGWLDFNYVDVRKGSLFFKFGNGIDYDMSGVRITSARKDDDGSEARSLDVKSSLSTISLRTRIELGFRTDSVGFSFGAQGLLPIATINQELVPFIDDTADEHLSSYGDEEISDMIKNALGHESNGFGLSLTGGISLIF